MTRSDIQDFDSLPQTLHTRQRHSILIVDDMPELRRILAHFLALTLDVDIIEADSGLTGIERFLEVRPDLIICDLTMPEMNGFEFLGFITRQREAGGVPIVVLTSEDDDQSRMQAAGLHAHAYLLKPFDASSVLETLRPLLPPDIIRTPLQRVA